MSLPNNDEQEGLLDRAKGTVKENIGRAVGDKDMETEGKVDRAGGKVQQEYGETKRKVGDVIKDVGDSISR